MLVFTAIVLAGKLFGVSLGAFLSGNGLRNSVRAGMSLAQIGEFSFIIASLGASTKATGDFIFPIAVAVSLLTSLTTPVMVRRSTAAAEAVDRRLPARLQTFVTFYDAWIEQLRGAPATVSTWARVRGTILMLAVDAALLLAVLAGSRLVEWRVVTALTERFSLAPAIVDAIWVVATLVLAAIFFVGVLRRTAALARTLAEVVVPAKREGKLDLGSAPRRVFTVALELALSLVVGLPLVALSQPFMPPGTGLLLFALVIAVLAYNVWRSVLNLQGHMRAGTELIVEMLAKQSREAGGHAKPEESLVEASGMLPGFPGMVPVRLVAGSPAIGRTLAQLNLRLRAGATVLAINREGAGTGTVMPTARERLQEGDVVTVAGTQEATEQAREILLRGAEVESPFSAYISSS